MDLPVASFQETDRWRWRDRRTVVALVAAVAAGAGLGIVAGLMYGMDFVQDASTMEVVDGFDVARAFQVGGVAALVTGFAALGVLRWGLLGIADRRSLTRRRACTVGGIGAILMVVPWFFIGLPIVTVSYSVSGHPESFPGELATRAPSTVQHFYFFEAVPALIGMIAIFVAVAFLGSVFRRPTQGM
jgi:hypothetical protein